MKKKKEVISLKGDAGGLVTLSGPKKETLRDLTELYYPLFKAYIYQQIVVSFCWKLFRDFSPKVSWEYSGHAAGQTRLSSRKNNKLCKRSDCVSSS